MTRQVEDLRPFAIGPDGYGVPPHIPHRCPVVEELPAQITSRLVAPQFADIPDIDQSAPVVAQQNRRVAADAVVECASAHDVEPVALEVLESHQILRDLAHGVRRQRPQRVGLADGQLVRLDEPVFLAGADDEESRAVAELADRLEEIHLADGVGEERFRWRLPGGGDERLRGQVHDVVRPRALEQIAHRGELAQVGLDQLETVAEVLDVLGVAAPAQRADHVRLLRQGPLGEMAADEPRDPRDQHPHHDILLQRALRGASPPGTRPRRRRACRRR